MSYNRIVEGYHGCDKSIFDKVVYKKMQMIKSVNPYDWLGHGIYFWEDDLKRAFDWSVESSKRIDSKIKEPAVIGARINLGNCLNLSNSQHLEYLKNHFEIYKKEMQILGKPIPRNKDVKNNNDLLLRYLDCAVIQHMHKFIKENDMVPFDTIRGVFQEGQPLYETSGIRDKNHIQICVCNPESIIRFFNPHT